MKDSNQQTCTPTPLTTFSLFQVEQSILSNLIDAKKAHAGGADWLAYSNKRMSIVRVLRNIPQNELYPALLGKFGAHTAMALREALTAENQQNLEALKEMGLLKV